jgi:replicative DNA helicase
VEVQNTKAEQVVLGSIINRGDLIKQTTLTESAFGDLKHQVIFRSMKQLEEKGEPIDIVSLNMHIGQDVTLIGGSSYLTMLEDSSENLEDFKRYERYVKESYKFKLAKRQLSSVNQEVTSVKDLDLLRQELTDIQSTLVVEEEKKFSMMDSLVEINEEIETEKKGLSGINTGFVELNALLDGLQLQELLIIAARPSVGKTALALAIANNVSQNGSYSNIFSLEMNANQLLKRFIAMIGNIDSHKLKNARERFSPNDWTKYTHAQGVLSGMKDHMNIVDRSGITLQEIRAEVTQSIEANPNQKHVVFIDYLTLIKTPGKQNRNEEVGALSRGLKRMARELNVSVVCLAQLSRGVENRQDKRPVKADLRDSGEIEQDADVIAMLYRDDYYDRNSERKNIIEVIIEKNRNGPLGTVELAYLKEYNSFVNLERSHVYS